MIEITRKEYADLIRSREIYSIWVKYIEEQEIECTEDEADVIYDIDCVMSDDQVIDKYSK